MHVIVNGKTRILEEDVVLLSLLESQNLAPDTVAVELNGILIDSSHYGQTLLRDKDQVEILRFVGGG